MTTPDPPAAALQAVNLLRGRRFSYTSSDTPDVAPTATASGVVVDPTDRGPTAADQDLETKVGLLAEAVAELASQLAAVRRTVEAKPPTAPKYPWEPGWSPFG